MLNQLNKLFGANFKSTFREKQVWFWSIFYPVFLLFIFLTIFGGSGSSNSFSAKIAVVGSDQTPAAKQVIEAMKHISALDWKDQKIVSREEAEAMVKKKDIDAAIVLPSTSDAKQITLILNKEKQNSVTTQALKGILNNIITQMTFQQAGVEPVLQVNSSFISSGDSALKYTDFLLTGLIALSISQAGLFGMVGMVEMRRNGLLKRLMMTPVSMRIFGLSNMLVRFILSAIQVVLLGLIGYLFYHASFHIDIIAFIIMFLIGTIAFTAIGFMIAALAKSMDSYFGIANLASFLMMFLSGIFFDTSSLPSYIKPISHAFPLTYFANGIRDSMVYGKNILDSGFWVNLGVLSAWGLVAFLIGSRFFSWKAETK